jgi:hypothetical protein
MIGQQPFFHSPLSPTFFPQEKGQALLLQFIIHELLEAEYLVQTPKITFTPYDWAAKSGTKNKTHEFALLLEIAFPELKERAKTFLKSLEKPCSELLTDLEPFIFACSQNENLLLFLVKHQKSLSIKSILDRICPEGLSALKKTILSQYKKRGFRISKWT